MAGSWRRGYERLAPANPQPDHGDAVHHGWGGPVHAGQPPITNNWRSVDPSQVHGTSGVPNYYVSTSGSGPHQNGMIYGHEGLAPYLPHDAGIGLVS